MKKLALLAFLLALGGCGVSGYKNEEAQSGYQTIYIATNKPSYRCELQNNSEHYIIAKTPQSLKVKVDGDMKITCTDGVQSKTCVSPSLSNYRGGTTNTPLDLLLIPESIHTALEAKDYYNEFSCLDLTLNTTDNECDNSYTKQNNKIRLGKSCYIQAWERKKREIEKIQQEFDKKNKKLTHD